MQATDLATSLGASAKVKLAEGVRGSFTQDGAVLLDINRGLCLSLNVVGAKIWQMLKQDWTGDQIVASLEREFGEIPRAQLQKDYIDFLQQLEANKLACLQSGARKT